jgi:uncharacterized protein (TIGR00369 family)
MVISQLSGLEQLQYVVEGKIPAPSMGVTMGAKPVEVKEGFAKFSAIASDAHLNPMGGVHGGFACTLLDSVTGCAVHSVLGPGESYGTIDLNVKMVRPVPKNTQLFAEGKLINISKSLGVSEGKLVDAEGKLYAHATCTCKIIRA